ncbi:hypothetical protein GCM10009856_44970 [Mycolicibacterium llatzerense]
MLGNGRIQAATRPRGRSQPLPLRVDPIEHAEEIARFRSRIVAGPLDSDCWVWSGALSDDGYGVFRIRRDGVRRVVRSSRYALALSLGGKILAPTILALHTCDDPVCARVTPLNDVERGIAEHVVGGTQRDNMERMVRMRRGGGRPAIIARGAGVAARAERSRAIRAAVADGWDADRVYAALLGTAQPTLW